MDPNELKDLKDLIEFLKANDIAEFDLEKDGLKVHLTFAVHTPPPAAPASLDMVQMARLFAGMQQSQPGHAATVPHLAAAAPADTAPAAAPAPAEEKHHIVKSPIVGTFYESPSPGAPPFVKVGDTVEAGQILCIVEAMKLMNEIESDAAGVVVERIAQSGHPVEYGQPLFAIKPN
jgi:acetyl-CoA carboxylase biotin carboxyl carrier protein